MKKLCVTRVRLTLLYNVSKTQTSVVARDGIEPPTQAFSGLCSTDLALGPRVLIKQKTFNIHSFFLRDIESQTGIHVKNLV